MEKKKTECVTALGPSAWRRALEIFIKKWTNLSGATNLLSNELKDNIFLDWVIYHLNTAIFASDDGYLVRKIRWFTKERERKKKSHVDRKIGKKRQVYTMQQDAAISY
jgi:hypothetical protein